MSQLKIAVGQINPTIGDLKGNTGLMLAAAGRAASRGAQIIVFPELSLTGYYPGDMLDEQPFVEKVQAAVAQMVEQTRTLAHMTFVFGAPLLRKATPGSGLVGKALSNSLIVARDGEVLATYSKQLLPTYGVFDERRHFEPGPAEPVVINVSGCRIGLLICEDGWNDTQAQSEPKLYDENPLRQVSAENPDLVVSINASPSDVGKRAMRHQVFGQAVRHYGFPLLYVNQVGGHDQLVYDGASFAMDSNGVPVYEANRFKEALDVLTFNTERREFTLLASLDEGSQGDDRLLPQQVSAEGMPKSEFYYNQIILGLRDYMRRCGFTHAVVGCSGGIDSALTLALAADALGPENVLAITMPSEFSSEGSVLDSVALCANLGVQLLEHSIKPLVTAYREGYADMRSLVRGRGPEVEKVVKGLTLENLQARIRGTILMEYSNASGALLLTTGNKSEIATGYCTLYGDTNGGLGLIGDAYKTEVFALSRYYNERAGREVIPESIISKPPSAELAPDQKDTDSLPPYEVLDAILRVLIEGPHKLAEQERKNSEEVLASLMSAPDGSGKAVIDRINHLLRRSEYKRRQAPPILRLRARAFGSGRQMPIAAVYPV